MFVERATPLNVSGILKGVFVSILLATYSIVYYVMGYKQFIKKLKDTLIRLSTGKKQVFAH